MPDGMLHPDAIAEAYWTCITNTAAPGHWSSMCGLGVKNF
jgi:hypothetical protein